MTTEKYKNNIIILGLVSLFTDLSSQMIYPLMPEFLVSLGASKAIIGIIEGIAECTAFLFRVVFGRMSDKLKRRKLFVFLGYGISTFSKPFLYFAYTWPTVLAVKFADRVGKSIRVPARDALISTSIDAEKKGKAFGFHRAMDRLGAVGGPFLAMGVLFLSNNNVRMVFLLSVIPGLIAVFFILFARETGIYTEKSASGQKNTISDPRFIIFVLAMIVFTLGNSSNAFLILKARDTGLSVTLIPVIWAVYNLFCSISSPIFGSLSDKIGRNPVIMVSFIYYALIYFLFGIASSLWAVWILFCAYGLYYGLSEGIFRAYIADVVSVEQRATAYGIFNTGIGIAVLPASVIMGTIWDRFGSAAAFMVCAGLSLAGFLIFLLTLTLRKNP